MLSKLRRFGEERRRCSRPNRPGIAGVVGLLAVAGVTWDWAAGIDLRPGPAATKMPERLRPPASGGRLLTDLCRSDAECEDGNACTQDHCDLVRGKCVSMPALEGTPCESDGSLCTVDLCDGLGTCVTVLDIGATCLPPEPPCDGGELCNPITGLCEPLPDARPSTPCEEDGDLCTFESCDGNGACLPAGDLSCQSPCPLCQDICDPGTGLCACVQALISGSWSADIWGLDGANPYPDNVAGIPGLGAVISGGVDVFLDVDAEIQSLCVLDGGILRVTQGGTFLPTGSLTVVGPEGIHVEDADLFVADGQSIDSSAGPVTIAVGGSYRADPEASGPLTASLLAAGVTILEGPAGRFGHVALTGSMSMESLSSLLMNGIGVDDKKGNCTPPDLDVVDSAEVMVAGDFQILNAARITYSSENPLRLEGDFVNQSIFPGMFDWLQGGLLLGASSGAGGSAPPQTIESAGQDRGRCWTGLISNFAFGTLELAAGSVVNVVDSFDNQQDGSSNCDEALYVKTLIVHDSAILNTDDCKVYYEVLQNDGSIPGLGTDVLQLELSDLDADCETGAADLAQLLGHWGACIDSCPPHCVGDVTQDCLVDPFDLAALLASWGPVN